MKRWIAVIAVVVFSSIMFSCQTTNAYRHHTVRMVDAKSYLDHPMSASLVYYYH